MLGILARWPKCATIVPLIKISQALLAGKLQERFPPQGGEPFYVHFKGGPRSAIASSLLRKGGYSNQNNIEGEKYYALK
jgi:rhodanese-related sulfurtransferase